MRKKDITRLLLLVSTLLFTSCQTEKFDVSYSVTSKHNPFPANIVFQNSQKTEQTLPEETLPWTYKFTANEGDDVKVSANVFSNGNVSFIGTDTLWVTIHLNGVKYKENTGVIISSGSAVVTVSGKL